MTDIEQAYFNDNKWFEVRLPNAVLAIKAASEDITDIELSLKEGLESQFTFRKTFGEFLGIPHPDFIDESNVRIMDTSLDSIRTRHYKEEEIVFIANHIAEE